MSRESVLCCNISSLQIKKFPAFRKGCAAREISYAFLDAPGLWDPMQTATAQTEAQLRCKPSYTGHHEHCTALTVRHGLQAPAQTQSLGTAVHTLFQSRRLEWCNTKASNVARTLSAYQRHETVGSVQGKMSSACLT